MLFVEFTNGFEVGLRGSDGVIEMRGSIKVTCGEHFEMGFKRGELGLVFCFNALEDVVKIEGGEGFGGERFVIVGFEEVCHVELEDCGVRVDGANLNRGIELFVEGG